METPSEATEGLANEVIGHAIEVHRHVGPGFPESVYEESLCRELERQEVPFERQAPIHVEYKGDAVGAGRADIVVRSRLIFELKCVRELSVVHRKQLFSYLRATGLRLGLLMNFNTRLLRDGLKRVINTEGST